MQTLNTPINLPILKQKKISLVLKREDLIHPLISGNKYRKLKYNILAAKEKGLDTLLTFGGAFSNHIAAVAAAGKDNKLKTIGIIRGDELAEDLPLNPTLQLAKDSGMQLHFVSRQDYRKKHTEEFLEQLQLKFGTFYLLPEGGTNALAIKGCQEILTSNDADFNVICASVGTGGTLAGLINASKAEQNIIGFPALKATYFLEDIGKWTSRTNWKLETAYHFGGYAKIDAALVDFINDFKQKTGIPLDPIYTGKLMYGLLDLIKKDNFVQGTRILAIHTGGLQGIGGMNGVLKKKNLPLLQL